jgi:hypothetical protein
MREMGFLDWDKYPVKKNVFFKFFSQILGTVSRYTKCKKLVFFGYSTATTVKLVILSPYLYRLITGPLPFSSHRVPS